MYRVDPLKGYPGVISKKMGDQNIGYYHYGIEIGDKVYDNLNQKGVDFDSWKDDLYVGELAICEPADKVEEYRYKTYDE